MHLTLSQTITGFHDPEKEAFRKHCGRRRKCWKPAFSPFSTMFSTLLEKNFAICATSKLSSANAFNLDKGKILSSGKRLSDVNRLHRVYSGKLK